MPILPPSSSFVRLVLDATTLNPADSLVMAD